MAILLPSFSLSAKRPTYQCWVLDWSANLQISCPSMSNTRIMALLLVRCLQVARGYVCLRSAWSTLALSVKSSADRSPRLLILSASLFLSMLPVYSSPLSGIEDSFSQFLLLCWLLIVDCSYCARLKAWNFEFLLFRLCVGGSLFPLTSVGGIWRLDSWCVPVGVSIAIATAA